ncbi:hypothetical protein BDZ88DRAFT_423927 [Geranomyces variabilis]|nr:hypothetical protein BDZ88DRAFT_423927 [Geranomyces variabilis]
MRGLATAHPPHSAAASKGSGYPMRPAASLSAALTSFAAVTVSLPYASAFDTGPHNDMTRNAMELFGYSVSAGKLAAIGNWFTDFYAFSPNLPKSKITPAHISQLEMMHCNNLYSIVYGANYIAQHVVNSRAAIQDAIQKKDVLAYLAILGTSMHTYQDFYAHSNWAELHMRKDCSCYMKTPQTMFSLLKGAGGDVTKLVDQNPELTGWGTYEWLGRDYPNFNTEGGTNIHGDYCNGINHDSYIRPLWEETNAYAFASSMEWIYNVETWAQQIDPTNATLNAARAWQPDANSAASLDKNFLSTFEVSYSATQAIFGESDGHWKGSGSGSIGTFAASVLSLVTTSTPFTDLYLRATDPVYAKIVDPQPYQYLTTSVNPTGEVIPNAPVITAALQSFVPFSAMPAQYSTDLTAVVVRTTRFTVSAAKNGRFSNADPWATVTIGGFEIKEAPARNQKDFRPYWTSVKWVSKTSAPIDINYHLIDAATTSSFEQDIPITAAPGSNGQLAINFDVQSRTVKAFNVTTGVYNNYTTAFKSVSDDGSSVELYLDTRPLVCANSTNSSSVGKTYIFACENTAYGELGVFGGCDGSRFAAIQPDSTGAGIAGAQPRVAAGLAAAVMVLIALAM